MICKAWGPDGLGEGQRGGQKRSPGLPGDLPEVDAGEWRRRRAKRGARRKEDAVAVQNVAKQPRAWTLVWGTHDAVTRGGGEGRSC